MIISGFKEKEFMINAISVTELSETKNFINLIFTDTYFGSWFHQTPDNERSLEKNIGNIKDSLHFNSVHIYGYGNRGGGIDDSLSLYKDYIDSLMNKVDSAGLRGFYGRNKIEQLSYGQRLIYEVASTNRSRVNSGFSYDTIMADTYQTDSSRTFLHATPIPSSGNNSPGWLCKNIYENLQHGDLINFTQWDTMKWFVKPVMRIKQNDFNDSSNVPVVAVVTVNFKGKKLDSVIIKVKNFADDNGNYQGNYINYYNFEDPEYPLKISGSRELTDGLSNGMIDSLWYQWKDSCKVDFKVYWFGEVEVWFDKMIVDDEWGNNLFHPVLQDRLRFESKIIEEVREFTDHMEQGSFFIDELSHSQIPCVKRVYEIMKQTNPDCKLNFAVTNFLNIRSYKDNSIGNRELLKEISAESFNADAHEVSIVYLPQSIPLSDRDPHFESWRFTNNSNYNRYLQERVFGDKSELTGINPIEGEDITNWNDYRPTNFGTLVY